jgi:exopolyphosphatase/guanosine-5'-triphosphate,3'-diphosphate pyrophosphatase
MTRAKTEKARKSLPARSGVSPSPGSRLVAAIEVGSSAVRMAIAEVSGGVPRILDSLQQKVSLGRDSFARGLIGPEATEECVGILRSFRSILEEYRITDPSQMTAVATSAVREASNRDEFLDRILIGTGIDVRAVEAGEISRLTYLAVRPLLEESAALRRSEVLLTEVGGGSTETMVLSHCRVMATHMYHVGSLRLRRITEESRVAESRQRDILQVHVDRMVAQITTGLSRRKHFRVLALGGDARLAASILCPDEDPHRLVDLPVAALARLTEGVLKESVDDSVRRLHISYAEAEMLGPALFVYVRLAQDLGLKHLVVAPATLRDGLLREASGAAAWSREFTRQILESAAELGARYDFDRRHAEHVQVLSRQLFELLRGEHQLGNRHELILDVAALLHDVGAYVSKRSHHKHSLYLIQNSDIFGLGDADLTLAAIVSRYHRRALPCMEHEEYRALSRQDRLDVVKLAAILRVADALDRGHGQRISEPTFHLEKGLLAIATDASGDLSLEQHGLREKAQMFERVYGARVVLRSSQGETGHAEGRRNIS